MRTNTSMRRLGTMGRIVGTAALVAVALSTACANPFDTDVDNPNAVIEESRFPDRREEWT